jgi:peptidoglycan L-alanyl-D-glutamate endopeptidase CwlK
MRINSRSLDDLLPQVRARAIEFIPACERKFSCRMLITSTYRNDEEQAALYLIGRQGRPGERIVTNAKAGESWHNWRCAWDMVPLIAGVAQWQNEDLIAAIGAAAKEARLTWGGDWDGDGIRDKADWDRVHFQWTGGLTLAQLQSGFEVPYA